MLYGLDIGGTKIELAVFNSQLEKQYSERVETPKNSYEDWLNTIVHLVKKADEKFGCKGSVGLGIPGFVNQSTGIAEITNIRVADNKPILRDLSALLDREVRAENDANCFALSEAWDAENAQYPSVLGLILGTGFGGGFVINGKIYSGQTGMAGELGHLQLNYHALKLLGWDKAPIYDCGCGNKACLDTYLSGRGFEMLYRQKTLFNVSMPVIKVRWILLVFLLNLRQFQSATLLRLSIRILSCLAGDYPISITYTMLCQKPCRHI